MEEEIIVRQKLIDELGELLKEIEVNFTIIQHTGKPELTCNKVLNKLELIKDYFSELQECQVREKILGEVRSWISKLSGRDITELLTEVEMEGLKNCAERWKEEISLIPSRSQPPKLLSKETPPSLRVTKLLIGDYQYDVKFVPVNLILGRQDPPRSQSDKPSYLAIKDEGGNVLYLFKDFKCLHGCPRPDAPEGCTHREHVKIEIGESVVVLSKMKIYPLYVYTGSGYKEVERLELRPGEKALISLAGLRWLEVQGERRTEERPYIEVSVQ